MNRKAALAPLVIVFLLAATSAHAELYPLPQVGGSVDLPAGWSRDGAGAHFANRSGEAGLLVSGSPADLSTDPRALFEKAKKLLDAKGEGARFIDSGRPAYIADLTFSSDGLPARGYLITIVGKSRSVMLLGYSLVDSYATYHDEILSALDSYAFDDVDLQYPGPVSQFYYPFPAPNGEGMTISIGGTPFVASVDVREIDAAQTVIDRETRVLAENKTVNVAAWRRYYRMIFRDNYHRIDGLVPLVAEGLRFAGKTQEEKATALLSWMQGFLYARTGTLADLSNPLLTLVTQSGDCDSRTLLYSMLLHHLGIGSILMVSSVYSHSMVGVLIDGRGARLDFKGKSYLVAELTAPVALGMIDAQMADATGWVPVDLEERHVAARTSRARASSSVARGQAILTRWKPFPPVPNIGPSSSQSP